MTTSRITLLLALSLSLFGCSAGSTDDALFRGVQPDSDAAQGAVDLSSGEAWAGDDVSPARSSDALDGPSGDAAESASSRSDTSALSEGDGSEARPAGPFCGDGLVQDDEVCDEGALNGTYAHCRDDCSGDGPRCGDGHVDVDAGEVCDDGVNDALAGGCLPGCQDQDLSDAVFDTPLLSIDITLPSEDWALLRHQRKTRHGMFGTADCRDEVIANPYTWFKGTVVINGTTVSEVGLRKKGHLGSQSTLKPSLKVKLHEFVGGQNYQTLKRFALNNGKSDKSYLRTCFAYQVFSAAGIPAPRCTRAHVRVNGVDMGPYVVVEEYKKPMMRRHFEDISGILYEGTACDWRPEFFGGFEQETNLESDTSKADLQAVFDVVEGADDATFEAQLAELVDLDNLYRFWAVESLIWHRDGYSGNANNYMVYADPKRDGRFVFLPWGPDSAFNPDNRAEVPDSVLAFGALVHRLYATDAGRERFYDTLHELLDTIWEPQAMVAQADAVRVLLEPHLMGHEDGVFQGDIAAVQETILARRSVIEESLMEGYPEWTVGMRTLPCTVPIAEVSGSFQTTWASLSDPIWDAGSGEVSVTLDGQSLSVTESGARAGWKNSFAGRAQLHLNTNDNRRLKFVFNFPDTRYFDPFYVLGPQPLIRPPMTANLVVQDLGGAVPNRVYELGEGTWSFTAVGLDPGDLISAEFQATLYRSVNN